MKIVAARLLKSRTVLIPLAALTIIVAFAALYWLAGPPHVTVAVGPKDSSDVELLNAFARALVEDRWRLRLTVLPVEDAEASAEALERKGADFAIVRPDARLPKNGLTVAIMREEAAIFLAPTSGKLKEFADLEGKKLGVVASRKPDPAFFATLLNFYNLSGSSVSTVPVEMGQVDQLLGSRQIDAVGVLVPPTGQAARDLARQVEKVADRKISLITVSEAEAIGLRYPNLSILSLAAGSLGGRPRQPSEDEKTVGISYRLMARDDLDRSLVATVAEALFQLRARIAQAVPAANLIKAPDSETSMSASLPNHPGAVDYLNREQRSFMDRYGDWIWLALFSMGGVSSTAAWLMQRIRRRRQELVDKIFDRLLCILTEARSADDLKELDSLACEVDTLVTHAIRYSRNRTTNTRTVTTLLIAIDSARSAVADRRVALRNATP